MPIEIRELVIRAHIEEADAAKDSAGDSRLGSISFAEKEAIIATCVEQVMKILEDKKER
jgi:hypothetical protein